jgi:hypothetical protein
MATKTKNTTKSRKRPTKSRAEKPLPDGLIERAAERAGLKATAAVGVEQLRNWDALLERAQREAVEAAPRHVPSMGDGAQSAIRAYDTIRWVRTCIERALGTAGAA